MLNRDQILEKAIHDCLNEMYVKSQPSTTLDQMKKNVVDGLSSKDDKIYERHYLSDEEYKYIFDKYVNAYDLEPQWKDHINILETYLKDGGNKEAYIKEHTDEEGNVFPGYKGIEKVLPLKNHIRSIIDEYLEHKELNQTREELTDDISNKVFELIETCKNYYRFGQHEYNRFAFNVSNYSPTSNKETVKKYWESQGVNIEFENRTTNPDELWEIDEYGHILTEEDE